MPTVEARSRFLSPPPQSRSSVKKMLILPNLGVQVVQLRRPGFRLLSSVGSFVLAILPGDHSNMRTGSSTPTTYWAKRPVNASFQDNMVKFGPKRKPPSRQSPQADHAKPLTITAEGCSVPSRGVGPTVGKVRDRVHSIRRKQRTEVHAKEPNVYADDGGRLSMRYPFGPVQDVCNTLNGPQKFKVPAGTESLGSCSFFIRLQKTKTCCVIRITTTRSESEGRIAGRLPTLPRPPIPPTSTCSSLKAPRHSPVSPALRLFRFRLNRPSLRNPSEPFTNFCLAFALGARKSRPHPQRLLERTSDMDVGDSQ